MKVRMLTIQKGTKIMKQIIKALETVRENYNQLPDHEKRNLPFEEYLWLNADTFGKEIINLIDINLIK